MAQILDTHFVASDVIIIVMRVHVVLVRGDLPLGLLLPALWHCLRLGLSTVDILLEDCVVTSGLARLHAIHTSLLVLHICSCGRPAVLELILLT